jgi:TonB family protein
MVASGFNTGFVSYMAGAVIRPVVVALACGFLIWAWRVKAPDVRHFLWRGVLAALFLLPLVQTVAPPLRGPSALAIRAESLVALPMPAQSAHAGYMLPAGTVPRNPIGSEDTHSSGWASYLLILYAAVSAVFLARLITGLVRLTGIAERSEFIAAADLHELAHELWLQSGACVKPRVRTSGEIAVPVVIEIGDPMILLPRSWQRWDTEKLKAAIVHEMAHIARRDPATGLFALGATCLFWFHPLSWFLRHRLADLAEQACDEIAVRSISRPERYARILVDFAGDVARCKGRTPEAASAAVRTSYIRKRIDHIVAAPTQSRNHRPLRALLVAILVPIMYISAAAHFGAAQQPPNEPARLSAHEQLLVQYANEQNAQGFMHELIWLIHRDPNSQAAAMMTGMLAAYGPRFGTPENVASAKSAWQEAIAHNPGSPVPLSGLAYCIERTDPQRALVLLQKASELAGPAHSGNYRDETAAIYASAVETDLQVGTPVHAEGMDPNTATQIHHQLEQSSDPALLSEVGANLVRWSTNPGQDAQSKVGFEYLERAIDLDPGSLRWKQALDAAKAEPARRKAFQALQYGTAPGTIRIGSGVAKANLVKKVEPQYPPLALRTRIQGTVEFNVLIGPEGHVQKLVLVRGHPLLVNAAKEAVLHWVYQPTLLNGKRVAVSTTIDVPFRLPE